MTMKGGVYMSALQEQAVQMIHDLSDDNVSFLIEIIQRLMSKSSGIETIQSSGNDEGIQAFRRLDEARKEVWNYLPEGFDPDKELEEARKERYGSIG